MATATVTSAGLNLLRDALRGVVSSSQVMYVAVGTSSTAPSASDTQLGAETFRKALTGQAAGSAGEALFTLYLAPGESVGTAIAEVGWFAGSTASGTANTGVLLARGLYSHTKLSTESISVVFDLTL